MLTATRVSGDVIISGCYVGSGDETGQIVATCIDIIRKGLETDHVMQYIA